MPNLGTDRDPDAGSIVRLEDERTLRAYQAVVPTIVRPFDPDVLISQHGCDCHYSDPLAHLSVSI